MTQQVEPNATEVKSYYVRGRHAMLCRADLGPIYEDYYLHLMQLQVRLTPEQDEMLKEGIAALVLHLMARPRDELCAWTVNFQDPPLNLFVTGDSQVGNVVGRVFTRDVKEAEGNTFFAQTSRPRLPTRTSTVHVTGRDLLSVAEQYYAQSEQLPARFVRLGGDAYAVVVAQPDIDMPWFESLDAEKIGTLEEEEELGYLETRRYHFACGCSLRAIVKVLLSAFGRDHDAIFQGEETLQVRCPRCAGVFELDPPKLERILEDLEGDAAKE